MAHDTIYSTRSSAARAARAACREALDAPTYLAAEGVDYVLHPQPEPFSVLRMSETPHRFELIGPAALKG